MWCCQLSKRGEWRHQKQAATHDAYRVTINQRRMPVLPEELLSGSEHRMPGWFLDMNIWLTWWGKHRRTTQERCIHCSTHGKLIGSSTICSKNYPLCYFLMLSNVACYAIDSHPLFHNIIILYKNSIKFIKFILQSSQYKFTVPSVQL